MVLQMKEPQPDPCRRQCRLCPEIMRSGCQRWLRCRYAKRLADLEDCRACLRKKCRTALGRTWGS